MATSDDHSLMQSIANKKEVTRAKKLYDATAQVPSPSKDFCQILITEKGIVWRKWKITMRNFSRGKAPAPSEVIMTYEDFKYDKSLQSELELIFGREALKHMKRILEGSNDPLSCLPEGLMILIATYLDLQSINSLSQTNCHFHELCNSNALWEKLYAIHQGKPSPEIKSLAQERGWKTVFFMNKLQIQKEISRRRRVLSHETDTSKDDHSSMFITQNVED